MAYVAQQDYRFGGVNYPKGSVLPDDVVREYRPKGSAGLSDDIEASDAARALADEEGIDLKDVTGTGSGGRITKADVQKAVG